MSVFKACDIRGRYGEELTNEVAFEIGYALGYKIAGREVVVGGDLRESTPALKEKVIDALLNSGAKVIDLGIVPTPLFYFAKAKTRAFAGVMITASHNPREFNGIKFILGDLPPIEEDVIEIEQIMKAGRRRKGEGEIIPLNLDKEYLSFIHKEILYFASLKRKLKLPCPTYEVGQKGNLYNIKIVIDDKEDVFLRTQIP